MKDNSKKEYFINKKKQDKRIKGETFIDTETIIKILLNKIITKSIFKAQKKEIDEKMKLYCYDYIINNINILLLTNFFAYDNDFNDNKEKIYYNRKVENHQNDSLILPEPPNPKKDRNNSNMIQLKIERKEYMSKDKNEKEIINLQKNSLNELTENQITTENKNETNETSDLKNLQIIKNDYKESSNNILNEDFILNLSYTDLEPNKYKNKYMEQNNSREINILRLDFERELKRRKKEKNIIKKETNKKETKPLPQPSHILNLKKQPKLVNFDFNKIAFDSKGNIIKKKFFSIDSLAKDFSFVRSMVHKIKIKKIIKNKLESLKSKTNTSIAKINTAFHKRFSGKFTENENIIKIEHKILRNKDNFLLHNDIEYNPKDKEEIFKSTKYSKLKEENKCVLSNKYSINHFEPEPGVVLKTKLLKKFGGNNFYNKYNRPTMKEFYYFLSNLSQTNSIPNTSGNMIKSTEMTSNIQNSNEKINETNENLKHYAYNGCKEIFEENNPLIKEAEPIFEENEEKYKKLNPKHKYKYLKTGTRSFSDNKIKKIKWMINDFSDSMKLSGKIQSSNNENFDNLYNYLSDRSAYKNFDFTTDTTEIGNSYTKKSNKNILKNIIKQQIRFKKIHFPIIKDKNKDDIKKKSEINNKNELFDSIEKFNRKIINDINFDQWGNTSEIIKDKYELSFNNGTNKPSALFKRLKFSKLDNKRERKNVVDIIKKNNRLEFERLYNFSDRNIKI